MHTYTYPLSFMDIYIENQSNFPRHEPITFFKMEYSLFFSDENNPLSQTIPDSPTELKFFIKLCEQRRKFPVLYKIEFTVSELFRI